MKLALSLLCLCPCHAPLNLDLHIEDVGERPAPMAPSPPAAERSLSGRERSKNARSGGERMPGCRWPVVLTGARGRGPGIRTMAEDLIPTAIIEKVAEMRRPDEDGVSTAIEDDGALPFPSLFPVLMLPWGCGQCPASSPWRRSPHPTPHECSNARLLAGPR